MNRHITVGTQARVLSADLSRLLRRFGARRPGFTITELLVVIAIIAVLAGIAIPAVMMAVTTAYEFRISSRMNQLELGVEAFRNEFGLYPPDHYYDFDGSVVPRLDPGLSDGDLLVALKALYGPMLSRIAPNHREFQAVGPSAVPREGSIYPIVAWYRQFGQYLNPTNALPFYLGGGLSKNPSYPLSENCVMAGETPAGYAQRMATMDRTVIFDFSEFAIDPFDLWGSQPPDGVIVDPFAGNAFFPDGCPRILRSMVQASSDRPLVYFVDSRWAPNVPPNFLFAPYALNGSHVKSVRVPRGYDGTDPSVQHVITPIGLDRGFNPAFFGDNRFQLIAPGRDMAFGAVREAVVRNGAAESDVERKLRFKFLRDNICNFAEFKRLDTLDLAAERFGF